MTRTRPILYLGVILVVAMCAGVAYAVRWGAPIATRTNPKIERCMDLHGYDGSRECYQQTAHQDDCDDCCHQERECVESTCSGLACSQTARLAEERCQADCILQFGGL